MSVTDSFSPEHIKNVIREKFSLSETSEIIFSMDKCLSNEHFTLLTVKQVKKVIGICRRGPPPLEEKYVLVKVPKEIQTVQNLNSSRVLDPVFVIKNNNEEFYGAFENKNELVNFVVPEKNNIESLKIILENLAEHQAAVLAETKELAKPQTKYSLKDITDEVTSLNFFKELNPEAIKESIENLQISFEKLLESNLLVRSIGCPLAKNVYVNQDKTQSVFLNVPSTKLVPPLYDALLYIFALTNEEFRQNHFENVVEFYLNCLKGFLQKMECTVTGKLTKGYSEKEVKVLLPVVKFTTANKVEHSQEQELLKNIGYFIKFPSVNQEDIYEITKTYLGSTKYDLLDYTLVCLNEKNGHLGEYFHLNIKVKYQGEERNLQLFAKFLITTGDLGMFLEMGAGKKEDFFYKVLLPLYAENGLGDLLDFAPKCYLSRTWLLVLDDLSRLGYVALTPNIVLGYEGLRAALKKLANFHSSSIILEEILSQKLGKTFRLDEKYGDFLQECTILYNEHTKHIHHQSLDTIYYLVEETFPEVTEGLNLDQEEIRARVKTHLRNYFLKVQKTDKIRNVVQHGDMYVGNILFKFAEDKIPKEAMLVDFQILRYASPTYEILFFLFENSEKEIRDKYFIKLLEDYYGFMSDNMRKFDLKPDEIFPKTTFYEDVNCMKSAGWMGAFGHAVIMHIDPVSRKNMLDDHDKFIYYLIKNRRALVNDHLHSEHYRNILKGLLEDLVNIIKT